MIFHATSVTEERNDSLAQKLSAKEAAIRLGTNARTLRKFLRSKQSPVDPVGQGNRYEFDSQDMKRMKKAFASWSNGTKTTKIDDMSTDEKEKYGQYLDEVEHDVPHQNGEINLEDLDEPTLEELEDIEMEGSEDF